MDACNTQCLTMNTLNFLTPKEISCFSQYFLTNFRCTKQFNRPRMHSNSSIDSDGGVPSFSTSYTGRIHFWLFFNYFFFESFLFCIYLFGRFRFFEARNCISIKIMWIRWDGHQKTKKFIGHSWTEQNRKILLKFFQPKIWSNYPLIYADPKLF